MSTYVVWPSIGARRVTSASDASSGTCITTSGVRSVGDASVSRVVKIRVNSRISSIRGARAVGTSYALSGAMSTGGVSASGVGSRMGGGCGMVLVKVERVLDFVDCTRHIEGLLIGSFGWVFGYFDKLVWFVKFLNCGR